MSSLRVPVFGNSEFVAEIYFIFLKTCPKSNSGKIGKVVIK